MALPPAGSSEGWGRGKGRLKNQDRGAPSNHPRTCSVDQGTETRRDPASNQGMGRPDSGVEIVIDSTKDAGGSFKAPPNLSDLASLSVRSPKAAISLNGAAAGEWPPPAKAEVTPQEPW